MSQRWPHTIAPHDSSRFGAFITEVDRLGDEVDCVSHEIGGRPLETMLELRSEAGGTLVGSADQALAAVGSWTDRLRNLAVLRSVSPAGRSEWRCHDVDVS